MAHLINPVGIENAQVRAALANALLGDRADGALGLELVHTVGLRLAVGDTLADGAFAATAANADAVDNEALLGLVAKATSLVGARGARSTVNNRQLAATEMRIRTPETERDPGACNGPVLPAADAKQEAEDVRLLLPVELLEVFVGT